LTLSEFYSWNEPLNYLDIYNQQQLTLLIKEYQPTLLFAEHDESFIEQVASFKVVLQPAD
jgi:lincosamide and streptogramin A transport system ATP-binding/permease protein